MGRVKGGSASQRIKIMNISVFLQESHLSQQNRSTPGIHYGCAMPQSPVQAWDVRQVCHQLCHTQPFISFLSFNKHLTFQTINGGWAPKAVCIKGFGVLLV